MSSLRLELAGEKRFGPCNCCGNTTARVWGYIYESDLAKAAYFVEWTPGHQDFSANFDFIVGMWGDQTTANDREAVALEFRKLATGPAFMVIDANTRSIATGSLVSAALTRDQVVGTPLAVEIFALCDLVYLEDPRLSEIRA